jgi:hypothetical protein
MVKLVVLVAGSASILGVSWRSVRGRRSHGFYRFLAWASILILILLNLDRWFADPLSLLHILAWLLLTASLFLVLHSLYLLCVIGKPASETTRTTNASCAKCSHSCPRAS